MYILIVFLLNLGVRAQNFNYFSDGMNNFGVELMYFTNQQVNNNFVVSPFGVWSVLTGVAIGATDISRNQLLKVLRLPNNNEAIKDGFKNLSRTVLDNRIIQSTNNLYYHMDISVSVDFKNILLDNFSILPLKLDFKETHSAALVANRLVLSAGIITQDIINNNDFKNSKVILTNVIKLRGLLQSPFSKHNTHKESFYVNNAVKEVNMMQQTGQFLYSQIEDIKSEVIELPYHNENISMIVVLPNNNVSLQYAYEGFVSTAIKDVIWTLEREGKKDVSVSIPRFKITSNLILNAPLISMGLEIFAPGASFRRAGKDFFVSKLAHITDVEVIETEGNVSTKSTPTKFFVANRPFVYMFIEKTTKAFIIGGIYEKPLMY